MDDDGHIIMASKSTIATAPDGNGGLFMALYVSPLTIQGEVHTDMNVIDHMRQHGIKFVQIYGVDNAVVTIPDPVMFGLFIKEGDDAGNKCVMKNGPHERVGVVCKKGGKYNVVEYSELSEEIATKTAEDGSLVFGAGFICNLYLTFDFLCEKCHPDSLPLLYHVAHKAIPYFDEVSQSVVKPKEPNGVKMESFIFDVFPASKKMGCLMVPRSEFTPVKNSNDAKFDCPESACRIMTEVFKKWLEDAGCKLEGEMNSYSLEISPSLSIGGENLEKLNGLTLQLPCLISSVSEIPETEMATATELSSGVYVIKKEYNHIIVSFVC